MKPLGVIVLAAGLGKRMRSAQAKVLHLLAGKPLLSRVITVIQPLQPDRLVVVVGHEADEVRRICGQPGIRFALQRAQRGTGDAVRAAQGDFGGFHGDILITCGDTPLLTTETLARFLDTHRTRNATLSVLTVVLKDAGQYGRVIRTRDGQIVKIVEARDASAEERAVREINTGIYCVHSTFLFAALERLRPVNAQGEYYLTDIVAQAIAAALPTQAVLTTDPHEVEGVNSREELAIMETTRQAQLRRHWMSMGVTLEDPDTVYIGEEVTIGQDTVIGPNTQLKGKTTLGAGCRIDGSAYIENCAIGDGAHIDFSCVLRDCKLASQTVVGPFAHVHAGTVLAPSAVIGNFVEVKRSFIGEHTKAKHLAYIGDTEIGRDANIGAGTITCNYDGFTKSKTKIGDRVQVGSDTTLIAPIEIPDDVYIATATTVRAPDEKKHIPPLHPGALVFNPREQATREGWVEKKRAEEKRKKAATEGVKTSAERESAGPQGVKTSVKRESAGPRGLRLP